jgi:hypothetical protein
MHMWLPYSLHVPRLKFENTQIIFAKRYAIEGLRDISLLFSYQ